MKAERPKTAGEINAYTNAVHAAAARRYPTRGGRIAWVCGWTARRSGMPVTIAATETIAYRNAYLAGWKEAGGAWGTIEESERWPK